MRNRIKNEEAPVFQKTVHSGKTAFNPVLGVRQKKVGGLQKFLETGAKLLKNKTIRQARRQSFEKRYAIA